MVAAAASQLGLFTPTPPGCGAAMTHGVLESELVTLHALLSLPTGPTIVAKQVCRRNGKKKTVAGGRNKWNHQYAIATESDYINIAGRDFKDTLQQ